MNFFELNHKLHYNEYRPQVNLLNVKALIIQLMAKILEHWIFDVFYCMVLAISVSAPLMRSNAGCGDYSIENEFMRIFVYEQELRNGDLSPRWSSILYSGFGYPLFNYHPPLFYLVTCVFKIASGLSIANSLKIVAMTGSALSIFAVFQLSQDFFGKISACISAAIYALTPINNSLYDPNPSLTIFPAYLFLPASIWGISRIIARKQFSFFLPASIAAIILSSLRLFLVYLPFFLIFVGYTCIKKDRKSTMQLFGALLLGLCASAFFWVPALLERQFIQSMQIIEPAGTSIALNATNWIAVALTFASAALNIRKRMMRSIWMIASLIYLSILLVLMVNPFDNLWNIIPRFHQERGLESVAMMAAVLAAFQSGAIAVAFRSNTFRLLSCLGILITALIFHFRSWNGDRCVMKSDMEISHALQTKNWLTTLDQDLYPPIWARDKGLLKQHRRISTGLSNANEESMFFEPPDLEWMGGSGVVKKDAGAPNEFEYDVTALTDSRLRIEQFYFPDWRVKAGDLQIEIIREKSGLFSFKIPSGQYRLSVIFHDPISRKISDGLSLLTVLFMILSGIIKGLKWRRKPNQAKI